MSGAPLVPIGISKFDDKYYCRKETIYGDFDIFRVLQHFPSYSMENVPMHFINHVLVKYKCNASLSTIKVTTFIYTSDISFYFVSCLIVIVWNSFTITYVLLREEEKLT